MTDKINAVHVRASEVTSERNFIIVGEVHYITTDIINLPFGFQTGYWHKHCYRSSWIAPFNARVERAALHKPFLNKRKSDSELHSPGTWS